MVGAVVSLFDGQGKQRELLCAVNSKKMYAGVHDKEKQDANSQQTECRKGGVPKRYIDSYLRTQDAPNDTLIKKTRWF